MRALLKEIEAVPPLTRFGRVSRIEGLAVEITGALGAVRLGGQVHLSIGNNEKISCEVVGFRDGRALVMPLGPLEGIALGARADFEDRPAVIRPTAAWLGRVIDGFGNAMDDKGPLPQGPQAYAQLSYGGGARNGTYGNVSIQDFNPTTAQPIGVAMPLDPHLTGGALKGMIDMRDQSLGGLAQTLGNFARETANAVNQVANANAAYPPPAALSGRNTGLLGTDALNFTGKTSIAVTGSTGSLVHRIDIDFDAGTISRDGAVVGASGATISSFAANLDAALGANGDASFVNGVLSVSATGGNGIVIKDDAATPASRGGAGFSHYFGLNDIFKAQSPSLSSTGLSAADPSGVAAGGVISLSLKGPDGDIVRKVNVTTIAGMTVGGMIGAVNTALGGAATLTLNADGSVSTAKSALYADYQLNVTADTTLRGATGMSFTALMGVGDNNLANQATGFAVTATVQSAPQRIGLAKTSLSSTSPLGSLILTGGDNSGALALQNVLNANRSFGAAGGLTTQTASLSDYARLSTRISRPVRTPSPRRRRSRVTGCRKRRAAWPPPPASIWTRN